MASSLLAHYVVMLDSQVLAMTVGPMAEFIKAPRKLNMEPLVGTPNQTDFSKIEFKFSVQILNSKFKI